LAASYLPVLTAEFERDRRSAWRLASVVLTWLSVLLVALVVLAELACGIAWLAWGDSPQAGLLLGLTAVMLPYVFFICVAAQASATLHALSEFTVPALVPAVLNIFWLAAAGVAVVATDDKSLQAYIMAASIVASGVVQLAIQLRTLRWFGFRYDYDWPAVRDRVREIVASLGPMVLGLAITQINTLLDSLLAWGLSTSPGEERTIAWLGGISYPMQQGAAAAVYYGERLYQFPLGMLGVAVATAIFPLLSRHAARGDRRQLAADLTLGLRLVVFLGLPASAGLILLAAPLAQALFEHGEFTAEDTRRTASMIAWYATGVWAYCAVPVVVRGYYAMADRATPVKVGLATVGFNVLLNAVSIWPLAEKGLAISTSLAAAFHVLVLVALFSRRKSALGWRALATTVWRTAVATALMTTAAWLVLIALPGGSGLTPELARLLAPLAAGVAVFFVAYAAMGGRELRILLGEIEEDIAKLQEF
ncbi:MAG: murein biosynthesis integral membrane protein MurJ, partial [Thermoguttaceae bacterium]|nr:murein biosynthesis integral membrane protein MurJ [Thermoguttaceae bacterium]